VAASKLQSPVAQSKGHNVIAAGMTVVQPRPSLLTIGIRPMCLVSSVKQWRLEMAINGRGLRDTGRVSGINKNTVIRTLKKASHADADKSPR